MPNEEHYKMLLRLKEDLESGKGISTPGGAVSEQERSSSGAVAEQSGAVEIKNPTPTTPTPPSILSRKPIEKGMTPHQLIIRLKTEVNDDVLIV